MPTAILIVGQLPTSVRSTELVNVMVDGANAEARRVAPCLLVDPTEDQMAEARLVLIGAVKRWAEAGAGALSQRSKTNGPFQESETVDTRQRTGYTFWPSEITKLQTICGSAQAPEQLAPKGSFPKAQRYPDPAVRGC